MEDPCSGVPRLVRAPALKRGRGDATPLSERVKLDRVLGLTVTSSAALDCDPSSGLVAYPAGCVLVLYNTRKNRQQHILNVSKKTITCLAFSWDGKYLATGECGHQPHVRIWDVAEKTQVAEFPGHKFGVTCVAFSPNLKYVVSVGTQHDMVVNVWDWRSNTKLASNKVSAKVKAVSFSSGGHYFVTVGNRHVKFWYLEYSRGTKYKPEPVPLMGRSAILGDQRNNYFCGVACGRGECQGSTFAITRSGLLCEFNSRRLLDKWVELRSSCANCISVGRDCLFVGCADGVVRCFSPSTLHFLATLPRPHPLGLDLALATGGAPPPPPPSATGSGPRHPHTVALCLDEMHRRLTCVYNDHSLFVWDVGDLKRIGKCHSYLFHSACIWGIENYPSSKDLLPPGTFLTCSSDDTIRVWNLDRAAAAGSRNIYCPELLSILYMDPNLTFICDADFQGGSSDKVDTTYDGKNGVRCLCISPDGKQLASGDRTGNIRIHQLGRTGAQEVCKIEAHDSEVLCLEYSGPPDEGGRLLASGSRDRYVHLFDVEQEYAFQQTLDDHSSSITAVRFVRAPGTLQMISCGADKSIVFRKAQQPSQGPPAFSRKHHVVGKTTLYDMEVDSSQEHILAACQDRQVRVYALASGKNTRCFRGSPAEEGTLIKVALDPTGTYLATSCTDKTLALYEYSTGECLASMLGHSELVTGLRFSHDGRHLISVSGDSCIFVWRLPPEVSQTIRSNQAGEPLPTVWQDARSSLESDRDPRSPSSVAVARPLVSGSPQEESPEYRFSLGPLPSWAKKQMMEQQQQPLPPSSKPPAAPPVPQPRGRWAQRFDAARAIFENGKELPGSGGAAREGDSSSAASGSVRMEDGDAEDEHSDTEGSGSVLYPVPQDGTTESVASFRVTEADLPRRRPHRRVYNSTPDLQSEANSEDEDSSSAAELRPLSLCVSTENLDKLGQREHFMRANYESLEQPVTPPSLTVTGPSPRSSLSARHHRPSLETGSLPSSVGGSTSNSSRRREELAQALNQARQKLNALGWCSSKSSGDLLASTPEENLIRRTASMTDISARRRLTFSTGDSVGLWSQQQQQSHPHQQPQQMQPQQPPPSRGMLRSASLGALHMAGRRPPPPQVSDDSSSSDNESPSKGPTQVVTPSGGRDWGGGRGHEGPRALVEPMLHGGRGGGGAGAGNAGAGARPLPPNPAVAPLSRELCERVAQELARITAYAIHVFQRVTMDVDLSPADRSAMTNTLAHGVLQAQQNLRPAAPPPVLAPPGAAPLWSAPSAEPPVFQQFPAARRFAAAEPAPAPQPLGPKGGPLSQSSSDLNALLQQYSEQLMKMVKEQMAKGDNKPSDS
ncbi:WD repeat domain 62 [Amblyomma americanum]